jgi:hypothetical protein
MMLADGSLSDDNDETLSQHLTETKVYKGRKSERTSAKPTLHSLLL